MSHLVFRLYEAEVNEISLCLIQPKHHPLRGLASYQIKMFHLKYKKYSYPSGIERYFSQTIDSPSC